MALREFTDESGRTWQVWDTSPSAPDQIQSHLAQGWLTFLSPPLKRRFTPIPSGWEDYSIEQLRAMLRVAENATSGERG